MCDHELKKSRVIYLVLPSAFQEMTEAVDNPLVLGCYRGSKNHWFTGAFTQADLLSLSKPVSSVSSIECSSMLVVRLIISDNRCVKA